MGLVPQLFVVTTLASTVRQTPILIDNVMKQLMMQFLVIVDASDGCSMAVFALRGTGTRNWNIRVTQYTPGDNLGGEL